MGSLNAEGPQGGEGRAGEGRWALCGWRPPRWSWRAFHVGMCFIAANLAYMLRNSLSIAIIPLSAEYHISQSNQGLLLSSFYIGYICFQAVGGTLATKYGAKWPIAFALGASALLNIVFPFTQSSLAGMVVLRVVTGMTQAFLYPSCYALMSLWIPREEMSKATSCFSVGSYVGTVLADFIAPLLSDCCGWPEIFYVFGLLPYIWLPQWVLFVSSSPTTHPFIDREELRVIDPKLSDLDLSLQNYTVTPDGDQPFEDSRPAQAQAQVWPIIIRSKQVWGLVGVSVAFGWINYLMMNFLPKFFSDRYGLSTTAAGWITSASYILMTISSLVFGVIVDWLKAAHPDWPYIQKTCACVGLLVPATIAPFLGLASVDVDTGIALALVTVCFLGIGLNGYASNQMDLSTEYAGTIMGFTNMWGNIPGAVGVYLSGWILQITDNNWAAVFGVATAVVYTGVIIYLIFGSCKPIPELVALKRTLSMKRSHSV